MCPSCVLVLAFLASAMADTCDVNHTVCTDLSLYPNLLLADCGGTCDDSFCCNACSALFREVSVDGTTCGACDSTHFGTDGAVPANTMCGGTCLDACGDTAQYLSVACGGSDTDDSTCDDCSTLFREASADGTTCGPCDASHFNAGDGSLGANTPCAGTCQAACGDTAQFLTADCGGSDADGSTCASCSTLFREASADGVTCGACDASHYNAVDGATSANTACSACASACAAGEFITPACGGTTEDGSSCAACSTLNREASTDGITCGPCDSTHYNLVDGNVAANTVCAGTCVSGDTCADHEYIDAGACGGTLIDDSRCLSCMDAFRLNSSTAGVCGPCDLEHWSPSDGASDATTVCRTCATNCTTATFNPTGCGSSTADLGCPDSCPAILNGGTGDMLFESDCVDAVAAPIPSGSTCTLTCVAPGFVGFVVHTCTTGAWDGIDGPACEVDKIEQAADAARKGKAQAQLSFNLAKDKAAKYIGNDAGMVAVAAAVIFLFTNCVYFIGGKFDSAERRERKTQKDSLRSGMEMNET